MQEVLKPLAGHQILLVLLQLAAILVVARAGAELVKRLGQPAVVGELAAGLLLGPSLLGHFWPRGFQILFPPDAEQFHLLEIIAWLGMVLLLFLTGNETDVKLLRNLGRSAIAASVFGMAVPFVAGGALGLWMPASFVANPDQRVLFALFLATAMSISAMPVIAKILIDLDLTRRNIGLVILSAGVVDDTTGWVILSLIAGAAKGGANLHHLAISIIGTVLFCLAAAFVLYPLLRPAFRIANEFQSKDTDLVLMIVVALLCAAATDALGVHAVFGAFVAGCVVRQVPHVRAETLHKLEAVTFSVFAPIFFGAVGLKVDLWQLKGGGGMMLAIVLGVACAGKLVGCTVGALVGGMSFWESISIAVAMNVRGAMGLVVALIGLALGIVNQTMYSMIVLMAIATTFMAPLLLRFTLKLVRVTDDEKARMAAELAKGMFDPARLKSLVPTAGGPNALLAARLALAMSRGSSNPVTLLYIERVTGRFGWLGRLFRGKSQAGQNLEQHLDTIKAFAPSDAPEPVVRRQARRDVAAVIGEEAAKGYDLVFVGSSEARRGLRGEMLERIVDSAHCHLAIVKHRGALNGPLKRVLVPIDGSFVSRAALEFSVRYAEGVGEGALVTIAYLPDPKALGSDTSPNALDGTDRLVIALSQEGGLAKLSPVFQASKVKTRVVVKRQDGNTHPIVDEAKSGNYDLIVLGAENRAVHRRLFFGQENERLVEETGISVAMVVPKVTSGRVSS